MSDQLLLLYDYNIWANERLIKHLQSLPDEIFLKDVDLGFKSIAEVIGHIISADEVWFDRIREVEGFSSLQTKSYTSIEEASHALAQLQSQIRAYLCSISDVHESITYTNAMGKEFQNTISELIQHVVNHGTYHRGNITTMLRSLGYKGVKTDYIAFLRC